jgi:D-alanine-D-alanine ligase
VLDLLGVPYTGAPTAALQLCKDKGLTKKILAFDGIRVPRFLISTRQRPLSDFTGFAFPAIVKPLDGEGSEGISQRSLVRHPFACASRVKELHRLTGGDVIIEEFIEGREIYAAVLGDDEVEVMPPREFRFARVAEGKPRIATFKAKWDDRYRRKWGLGTAPARGLGEGVEARVEGAARAVYKAFQIKGYARVDFRLDREGVPVFLEANPNPAIGSSEDFAKAARKAGVAYDDLIARIVGMTLAKSSKRAV